MYDLLMDEATNPHLKKTVPPQTPKPIAPETKPAPAEKDSSEKQGASPK